MTRVDHITLPVKDWRASRDWYIANLGFRLAADMPEQMTAAVRDDGEFTLFFVSADVPSCPGLSFTLDVEDVHAVHQRLTQRGAAFEHGPQAMDWGYGAELRDLNGYSLRIRGKAQGAANG